MRPLRPSSSLAPMRIVVDGRHLSGGRGIARYLRSLLHAWGAVHPEDGLALATGGRATFAAAALTGRPRLDRMTVGGDVVWAPAPAPLAVSPAVPFVLTVHDVSWVRRPSDFTPYERLWHRALRFDALVARADRIITDAQVTADELVGGWDVAPDRIAVIRPGPGLADPPLSPVHDAASGRAPYFLAVGALEPRKAPEVAARAHALARTQGLQAELVFAGAGRVAVAGDGIRVVTPDDRELAALYAGALAVVHPAWLEGFAFPPVEGLAHGTPAIVADLPLYDETVGEGALRFAPGDEAGLARAMLRLERVPDLRAQLVRTGQSAIASLSWHRAARETRAVLAAAVRR